MVEAQRHNVRVGLGTDVAHLAAHGRTTGGGLSIAAGVDFSATATVRSRVRCVGGARAATPRSGWLPRLHPDAAGLAGAPRGGHPPSAESFRRAVAAYHLLRDPQERQRYDSL